MTRRPSPPPPTEHPPPPDPIDAAEYHYERARRAAALFRDAGEPEETGQHPPINLTVNIPERASQHELEAPEPKKHKAEGLIAAIIFLAASLTAVCKALGWIK